MIIIVLNDTTNATDTTDLTAWFRSAQDSSPLLFNGLQLYRHNDSLVVLFAAGKSSLFELVHYAVYMAKVYFNKLRTRRVAAAVAAVITTVIAVITVM